MNINQSSIAIRALIAIIGQEPQIESFNSTASTGRNLFIHQTAVRIIIGTMTVDCLYHRGLHANIVCACALAAWAWLSNTHYLWHKSGLWTIAWKY